MKRGRIVALVAVLAVGLAIGLIAMGRSRSDAVEAKVQRVQYGRFVARLPETGVIQRPQTHTLTALVAGNIARVLVAPGERVRAGQPLVELTNPQLLSNEEAARAAYQAATGRVTTAAANDAVQPAQNRSNVQQAQYNLEQAKFNLNAALTDQRNGAQSGLGYGGSTAQAQRVAADANLAGARTTLSEAQRIYDADADLYANRAISRDALEQQSARLAQAKIAADQAQRQRDDTYAQLDQNVSVLADRVRAARDAVAQAQAALTAARVQAAQSKSGDVVAARGDAAARASDWRFAQDQVARLTISAPYAGIVQTIASQSADALRPLGPGDPVNAGQEIVTLSAATGFIVRARVDEQDIAHVRAGQLAHVSGEDLGEATLTGHVTAIGQVAQKSDDPANTARQIVTTIALDRTLPFLRDGMNVDVDIVTADRPHVLAVDSEAIRRDGAGPYVFVVGADGRAHRTPVTLGQVNDTQTIVTRGLAAGDAVVVDRTATVAEGVEVKPAPSAAAAASPGA